MESFRVVLLASRVVHQLLLGALTAAFVLICGVRFTIVESPELTPFLPSPGGVSSSCVSLSERFLFFDEPAPSGLNPFSHSFRCIRNTAIVALASVTCPSSAERISQGSESGI